MERATGIEPASSAWKAGVLPLNYARKIWSGRQDLNLRHPAPKAGALPNCATSRRPFSLAIITKRGVCSRKIRLIRERLNRRRKFSHLVNNFCRVLNHKFFLGEHAPRNRKGLAAGSIARRDVKRGIAHIDAFARSPAESAPDRAYVSRNRRRR